MNIGFAPCGYTSKEIISKLLALGGINKSGFYLDTKPTQLYWYIESDTGNINCDHSNRLDVKLNPIDHKFRIDSLHDLPSEMRKLIMLRQNEVGNKADLSVFEKRPRADTDEKGFNWDCTPEGINFWSSFLQLKEYYLYYTLNINKNENKLQREETSVGRSKDITGSGIRCERRKPTIASGHLRDRKTIKF